MFSELLVRTIYIINPGTTTDRYGNEVTDWTIATETAVAGWFAPQGAEEDTGDRSQRTLDGKAYLNPAAPVAYNSRLRLDDGKVYEAIGPPQVFHTPSGPHHIEVECQYVEG